MRRVPLGLWAVVAVAGWCSGGRWGGSTTRISQIYTPVAQRMPSMRDNPLAQVQGSWVFKDAIAFAELTTMPVNRDTAERAHALALRMLQYSPEPRVIERLMESATLLGLDDEAAFHLQRYRVAYPKDHARWQRRTGRRASRLCLVGRRVWLWPRRNRHVFVQGLQRHLKAHAGPFDVAASLDGVQHPALAVAFAANKSRLRRSGSIRAYSRQCRAACGRQQTWRPGRRRWWRGTALPLPARGTSCCGFAHGRSRRR